MNNPLIAKKLESLTHCLKKIESKRPDDVSTCSLVILTTRILFQ